MIEISKQSCDFSLIVRGRKLLTRVLGLFLTSLVLEPALSAQSISSYRGKTMGTYYAVKYVGVSPAPLQPEFERILKDLNRQMSTYINDSEISTFNRLKSYDWFPVSPEFGRVVQTSKKIFALTDGAFDPTLNPLVSLWGFGPKGRPETVPTDAQLKQGLESIGFEKIVIAKDQRKLKKQSADLTIDLSAIAKGYAADVLSEYLNQLGFSHHLVEIGGEVRTSGQKPGDQPWVIAIEMPSETAGGASALVAPRSFGLATSGDYRNFYEIDGKRMSHIIDPRTGYPISHDLASVSVLSETCGEADGLATAFMVMGREKAYEIAVKNKIPAYFIYRKDDSFATLATPEFARFRLQ
ncbi:MAG: FAD:protein FMN transferase [Pseudobacteriovorax sp.]|nr:FAD:protein FMN transferase [Pseudobacteriovorax sp.]